MAIATAADAVPAWVTVAEGSPTPGYDAPLRPRRMYAQVVAVTVIVLLAVAVTGAFTARQIAEREAINDASRQADILADAVIQPALVNAVPEGDPAARAALDKVVRERVLGTNIIRVKLWTSSGRIVYSDEPRLIGDTFPLGEDEKSALREPAVRAEVTDLKRPENRFERGQGKLLEVYRPVWTPDGQPLLFEIYAPYQTVVSRAGELWRGFAGITFSSLLVLILLMLPVLWRLQDRLRRSQQQRETLLTRAVEASDEERRRIAATLHDGTVQELAAASFVVSGAVARLEQEERYDLAASLRSVADTVRTGIGGLRSLLVDIYPPHLENTGLTAALTDLTVPLRSRDIDVRLELPPDDPSGLTEEGQQGIFRVAQEALRNAARHANASRVDVRLFTLQDAVVLEVGDNGVGFDVGKALAHPETGHFGLRLMSDAADRAGAVLRVSSSAVHGTWWQLRVPSP